MIAYTMLYTFVAGLPILLAAVAVSAVLRRYGRSERGVWLVALVLAFALPVVSLLRLGTAAAVDPGTPLATGVIGLPEVVSIPIEPSGLGLGLDEILLLSWLAVSAFLVLRWAVGSYRLMRVGRAWRSMTLDGVPVWLTEDLGPAVSGVILPRLLVPSWMLSMPWAQRSLVLLHEQEHIRAWDPMLMALARIVRTLAPWNPVVWVLSSRLLLAIELDCDRRVLRHRPDVATYGHTLLNVSSRDSGRLVAVATFAESEAPLRSRILAMTTPSRTISAVGLFTSATIGALLLVGACEVPVPAVTEPVAVEASPRDESRQEAISDPPASPTPSEATQADSTSTRDAEPPSASETIEELRETLQQRPSTRGPVEQPTAEPTPEPTDEIATPDRPSFTAMTVRPTLTNVPQVQQALMDAYPALLRDAGVGGAPVMWLYIGTDGAVQRTLVQETSGYGALDEAAAIVARAMRFTPAQNRDQLVPVWVQIPIRFQVLN